MVTYQEDTQIQERKIERREDVKKRNKENRMKIERLIKRRKTYNHTTLYPP